VNKVARAAPASPPTWSAEISRKLRASRAEIAFKQAVIDKLTHENAILKRLKFAARSEAYNAEQKSLLEETPDSDLAAVAAEIEAMAPSTKAAGEKQAPKRERLPANLPRREIHHEPENTTCGGGIPMQRIGEDVAEKQDPSRPGSSGAAGASTGAAHRPLVVIVVVRRVWPGCWRRSLRAPRRRAGRRTSAPARRPGCRGSLTAHGYRSGDRLQPQPLGGVDGATGL